MTPAVSVVMPVHNARPYLDEAIASILAQSFGDFEFVLLDDGSTDGSGDMMRAWAARDDRIRLVASPSRSGPVGSSNRVVAAAKGALIARMDADDISHPDRLRRQLDLFQSVPDAVLAGVLHETLDHSGRRVRAADRARVRRRSPFPPFAHGSVMMRRSAFDAVGGYRSTSDYWEDIDLYLRMAGVGRIFVIPEALYGYRLSATSTRLVAASEAVVEAYGRMYACIERRDREGSGAERPAAPIERGIPPAAFELLGSSALWSGRAPGLARLFVRRARLGLNAASVRAVVWIVWASLSPRSLRLVLRTGLQRRNRKRAGLAQERWVEWVRPG